MEETVKEPKVRNAWVVLLISTLIIIIIFPILYLSIKYLYNTNNIVFYYRAFNSISILYIINIILFVAIRHYKYLMLTGKDTNFNTIIYFYFYFITMFGLLYGSLYNLKPLLFRIKDPIYLPAQIMGDINFNRYLAFLDFFIYSCCNIFPINYPRIESNSMLISALNVFEVIIGVGLISLFISTFVQKFNK